MAEKQDLAEIRRQAVDAALQGDNATANGLSAVVDLATGDDPGPPEPETTK
ncbi:hypothetical protein [Lentzea guizhouensis]|uniref:hypothetical protein n=1 Tax=Lentzea guizhouensis TaxID=1586287 RepID=UPI0012B696E8|nr:hypothetical protein [Lentzea guizhouensis]